MRKIIKEFSKDFIFVLATVTAIYLVILVLTIVHILPSPDTKPKKDLALIDFTVTHQPNSIMFNYTNNQIVLSWHKEVLVIKCKKVIRRGPKCLINRLNKLKLLQYDKDLEEEYGP